MAEATRTEYRVIADRHGFTLTADVPVIAPCASVQEAREGLEAGPIGLDAVYRNFRIQKRIVTETPWEDVADD